MPKLVEVPQFIVDRFIKRMGYGNKVDNYLMQKRIAQANRRAVPGEYIVGPVNFTENKGYENYKRRVDRFNREAERNNEDVADKYLAMAEMKDKYDDWEKAHAEENKLGLERYFEDEKKRKGKADSLRTEIFNYYNRAHPWMRMDPDIANDFYTIKNKGLVPDYMIKDWRNAYLDAMSGSVTGYVQHNPNPYVSAEMISERNPSLYPKKPSEPTPLVTSPQKYIYRYHTTKAKNIPYIYRSGLDPKFGGKGYGSILVNGFRGFSPEDIQQVYTETRGPEGNITGYFPDERSATIRLKIPKKDYLKFSRLEENPEVDHNYNEESHLNEGDDIRDLLYEKELTTVQHGGRTDIFENKISPKYIDGIYDENRGWQDPIDFLTDYECGQGYGENDCDDWYEAIRPFLYDDDNWNYSKIRKALQGRR